MNCGLHSTLPNKMHEEVWRVAAIQKFDNNLQFVILERKDLRANQNL